MTLRVWLRKHRPQSFRPAAERRWHARRQSQRRFEPLEPRLVLGGLGTVDCGQVTPAWFGTVPQVYTGGDAVSASSLAGGADGNPADAGWPRWIVRVTEDDAGQVGSPRGAEHLLDEATVDFQVIRGLGLPGQVLVRAFASSADARAALAGNPHVAAFEADDVVVAQVLPDDPDFPALWNLHNVGQFAAKPDADIDAPEAWDKNIGSTNVVVGAIDSGIDVTHPDLYLNIWINQGEIPPTLEPSLTDVDSDGRITFYDLNDSANAALVKDFNANGYIDAIDLLDDPRWADGLDTDGNGFIDDFFGWNFRTAPDEPFAPNDPRDALGHGTHVAGTIGAIGNNGRGVTGVNWRSSLMSLKFLDNANQGQTSDATLAVNYATMMRTRCGENVRVLNASWGQSGSENPALRAAIEAAGQAGLLFVAAAGNGNILGQGINLDREPFYPASYDLDNIISVAATDPDNRLGRFSNFGAMSVDLAAPGIGVLSTLPGGRYGTANGTSMAAPHVSGVAAFVWSLVPHALMSEVRDAIFTGADPIPGLQGRIVTGGRLNAYGAVTAETFAPQAQLLSAPDVTTGGEATFEIIVQYSDNEALDRGTLDDADIVVTHLRGTNERTYATLVPGSIVTNGPKECTATYQMPAPGGSWDVLDYGDYEISLQANQVRDSAGFAARPSILGAFHVQIADPSVFYVNSFVDAVDAKPGDGIVDDGSGHATLRAAIQEANAAKRPRTLFLDAGTYRLSIEGYGEYHSASGDLDVSGNVNVVGAGQTETVIDANHIDRVFHILPKGALSLSGVTVTGGYVSHEYANGVIEDESFGAGEDTYTYYPGGGIYNLGALSISNSAVSDNMSLYGGGIYNTGNASIATSTISENIAGHLGDQSVDYGCEGGGVLNHRNGDMTIEGSTISYNRATGFLRAGAHGSSSGGAGGGVAHFGKRLELINTTISGNKAGSGGGISLPFSVSETLIVNCTISGNSANSGPGGVDGTSAAIYKNTIIAGNIAVGSDPDLVFPDIWYNATSQGFNLIGRPRFVDFSAPGDQIAPNAADFLGPLQDNGGPTFTHALLPGSSAIDAGTSDGAPEVDQRGVARPQDGDLDGTATVDIGAFETFFGEIRGTRFHDRDDDRVKDSNEPGLSELPIFLDLNLNGTLDPDEPTVLTDADDPTTAGIDEGGAYSFSRLEAGHYRVTELLNPGWEQTVAGPSGIQRVSTAIDWSEAGGTSENPSINADGRYVAFESRASLVPEDVDGNWDVYVYDRQNRTVECVSVAADGSHSGNSSYDSSLSADGRYVAFTSWASLVPEDTNDHSDVYVYDRLDHTVQCVSFAFDGTPANDDIDVWSAPPSISPDGRYVAFASRATNLVPDGRAGGFVYDRDDHVVDRVVDGKLSAWSSDGRYVAFGVYVYDRQEDEVERMSPTSSSSTLSMSANGRYVAFDSSDALVPEDANQKPDVFVYDRQEGTTERVSVSAEGLEGNGRSMHPSISADGRYVGFYSDASNLVPGDGNDGGDFFVYDRESNSIERVSVAADGSEGIQFEHGVALSADGRWVAFESSASNLVPGDTNGLSDILVNSTQAAESPLFETVVLGTGQVIEDIDFGNRALPGEIRGRCFQDLIVNGIYDPGEPGRAGITVYLDLSEDGQWDSGEPATEAAADGSYVFSELSSFEDYQIGVVVPDNSTLVLPTADENGSWKVFLPAGGTITDRDFGLRPAPTVGQFENAVLTGRLFADGNGNGRQEAGESGMAGATLFLDLNDDGVRQFNEPRTISTSDDLNTPADETGQYSFEQLGNRPYTVRVLDLPRYRQTAPIGDSFSRHEYSLALPGNSLGGPQDVAIADFNGDGWPDLATAVYDRNSVAVLPNDQHGGFTQPLIEIPLAPADRPTASPRGVGPIALLAGDFNGQGGMDLAVVNSLSSNIAILLDFDGTRFASESYLTVGTLPNSVASGDVDGDQDLDLVVTNSWNGTVSILCNDGQGRFTTTPVTPAVGNHPFEVAVVDFNEDGRMDLAVADFGTHPQGGDLGDVRVLLADGSGSYQSQVACLVGFGPAALVANDLNGDGHLDLAVANFLSDNVTVCRGAGDGTFMAVATLTGGSGPMDIDAADLEGDGDFDLLVTNGKSKKVGILRNRLSQGVFEFEPAESFGVANFPGASQSSLATGDLDGNGTLDVAVASSQENSVAVHLNTLVGGAQRLALTGIETVSGLDFAFQPVNLPPTLDTIADPPTANEDAGPLTVSLTGISAGSGESQPLRVSAGSDNPALIADATGLYQSPDTTGSLRLSLGANQWGEAVVTVQVTDGGLDGDFGTEADNRSVSRSFRISVLPVNDPPVAADDTVATIENLARQIPWDSLLANDADVDTDARQWSLSVGRAVNGIAVNDVAGRRIRFTPDEDFRGAALFVYTLTDGMGGSDDALVVVTVSPPDQFWQNPLDACDVNAQDGVTAQDVLIVINFINSHAGDASRPDPPAVPPPYYDVNGDGIISAADVLAVINWINAPPWGSGEAEPSEAGVVAVPNLLRPAAKGERGDGAGMVWHPDPVPRFALGTGSGIDRSVTDGLAEPASWAADVVVAEQVKEDVPDAAGPRQSADLRRYRGHRLRRDVSLDDNSGVETIKLEAALADIAEDIAAAWGRPWTIAGE